MNRLVDDPAVLEVEPLKDGLCVTVSRSSSDYDIYFSIAELEKMLEVAKNA